jgi:hypothetical protein
MTVVANIKNLFGLIAEEMNPLRAVRIVAACTVERPASALGVAWTAHLVPSGNAAVRPAVDLLMALLAEISKLALEDRVVVRGMRLVALHALPGLNRRMRRPACEPRIAVAIVAESRHGFCQELLLARLVRLMAVHAHAYVGRAVAVPSRELPAVMALCAEDRHIWVQEMLGFR